MASLDREPPPSYAAATAAPPDKPLVIDPAPNPGWQIPPAESPQTTTLVSNPIYEATAIPMVCPHCRAQVTSVIDLAPTQKTHLIAALLCIFGCWCCACIPYCVDSCKRAHHFCPDCGALMGTYKP